MVPETNTLPKKAEDYNKCKPDSTDKVIREPALFSSYEGRRIRKGDLWADFNKSAAAMKKVEHISK